MYYNCYLQYKHQIMEIKKPTDNYGLENVHRNNETWKTKKIYKHISPFFCCAYSTKNVCF